MFNNKKGRIVFALFLFSRNMLRLYNILLVNCFTSVEN